MKTKLSFLTGENVWCFGQEDSESDVLPSEVITRNYDFSQKFLDALINRLYAKEHYQERCLSIHRPIYNGALTFGWWNVGLAYGDNINDAQYKKLIVSKVNDLIGDIDILGLGEFASEEVFHEIERMIPRNYSIVQLYEDPDQRLSFDTAVIFNKASVLINDSVDKEKCNMFWADGAVIPRQYRIAQKVRFRSVALNSDFDIYFVHWRQHDGAYESERKRKAGEYIHRAAFGDRGQNLKDSVAVLMGDFNAEPSERVFSDILVSRSRKFVEKHGGFFNPFWRKLHDENWTINCGNTSELRIDKCLFDYIMVSSQFLRLPKFRCTERIYGDRFYRPPGSEHRPVSLTIFWEKEVG